MIRKFYVFYGLREIYLVLIRIHKKQFAMKEIDYLVFIYFLYYSSISLGTYVFISARC